MGDRAETGLKLIDYFSPHQLDLFRFFYILTRARAGNDLSGQAECDNRADRN